MPSRGRSCLCRMMMFVTKEIRAALDEANRLRLEAYEKNDAVLHLAANLAVDRIAGAATDDALRERARARLRARGIAQDPTDAPLWWPSDRAR